MVLIGDGGAIECIVGIRAVQHNDGDLVSGTGFHKVVEGADVGVEAYAYVCIS